VLGSASAVAQAGMMNYSWSSSHATAVAGDTVTLSVQVAIAPSGPFVGLAVAAFGINVADVPGGGILSNTLPLGLQPSFVAAGQQGTLVGNSIMGIQAAQLPPMLNPLINTSLSPELYQITYTVTDGAPRTIVFGLDLLSSNVYTGPTSSEAYSHAAQPFMLEVLAVPTPGALALLGLAGLVGTRRRRTM
jgi:MYXO-CTERM domain-containing protein